LSVTASSPHPSARKPRIQRRVLLNKLLEHLGINKAGIHVSRFIINARIAIATGGVKA
jgi:hypothetical protein